MVQKNIWWQSIPKCTWIYPIMDMAQILHGITTDLTWESLNDLELTDLTCESWKDLELTLSLAMDDPK